MNGQALERILNQLAALRELGFHGWSAADRLMDLAEVVVESVEANGMDVVLELL